MNIFTNVSTNQAAILGRTIIPDDRKMPEDMARFLIGIRLTEQDTKRMNELVVKAREGNLARMKSAKLKIIATSDTCWKPSSRRPA